MAAVLFGIIALPSASLVAVLLVEPYEPPTRAVEAPVVVPTSGSRPDIVAPATVEVTFDPEPSLALTPGFSGVVTEMVVLMGDEVSTGTRILHLDGLPVYALISPTPLHRDITRGDEGRDVAALQGLMRSLGHLSEDVPLDGVAGEQLMDAIEAFNDETGWPETRVPTKWGNQPVFPRAATAYGGSAPFLASATTATVGRVPEQVQIVSGQPVVASVSLKSDVDLSFATDAVFRTAEGLELRVERNGQIDLEKSGDEITAAVDPEEPVVSGSLVMTPSGSAMTVPASAIVQSDGATCVLDPSGRPVLVTVIGTVAGRTYVDSERELERVLGNPNALGDPGTACS